MVYIVSVQGTASHINFDDRLILFKITAFFNNDAVKMRFTKNNKREVKASLFLRVLIY